MAYSNKVKALLINPPPEHRRDMHDAPGHPHLGLAYLGGYLRSKGINCAAIDAKFEMIDLAGLEKSLLYISGPPNLVGITAMTHEISQAARVAQVVKRIWPQTITVVGGAHATALPKETLQEFPQFDIVVFGEGEDTLYESILALGSQQKPHAIKGICYRQGQEVHANEPREQLVNLGALPHPAWDIFPRSKTYPVMTTRGCPFRCNFCMRVSGNLVRKRSPEDVVAEVEEDAGVYGANTIIFDDESFAIDKKYAHQILDLMLARGLGQKIKWWCNTRVDLVDRELLERMKAAGCIWIGYGVESGSEEILKATNKRIRLEQVTAAVQLTKEVGLKIGSYFILGHPFETRKTIQETIDFATKLNTTTVAFGIMVPYPGTEVYEMAIRGEGGYKVISQDWSDFNKTIGNALELKTLNRKQLEILQLWAFFKVYIFNGRFIDFLKLFWTQRRVLWSIIRKMLG